MTPVTHVRRRFLAIGLAAVVLLGTVGAATVAAAPARSAAPTGPAALAELDARGGRCGPLWITASADPTIANWQAVGLCEVDRRLDTIAVLETVVDRAAPLTDAHQAALEAILADSAAGLRALRGEIEADTTLAALREDISAIATELRIYLLVVRQVHLVVAADAVEATVDRFGGAIDSLEAAIARAEADGRDVTEAKRFLAGLVEDVAAADAVVDGVADRVLPLTPADWNDGTAEPVLRAARQAIVEARGHLREAGAAARQILASLH